MGTHLAVHAARTAEAAYVTTRDAPGAARRFLRDTLFGWGDRLLIDPAQLLVSELVTNAVVHGGDGAVIVRLLRTDGCLRIEVVDGNADQMPRLRPPRDEGARGLHIVDTLAAVWGYEPGAGAKTVWCELEVEPSGTGAS